VENRSELERALNADLNELVAEFAFVAGCNLGVERI